MKLDPLKDPAVKAIAEGIKKQTLQLNQISKQLALTQAGIDANCATLDKLQSECELANHDLSLLIGREALGEATLRPDIAALKKQVQQLGSKIADSEGIAAELLAKLGGLTELMTFERGALDDLSGSLPEAYKAYYRQCADTELERMIVLGERLADCIAGLGALNTLTDGAVLETNSAFLLPRPKPEKFFCRIEGKPYYKALVAGNHVGFRYAVVLQHDIEAALG